MAKRAPKWGWLSFQDFATWVVGAWLIWRGATLTPINETLVFAGLAIFGVPFVRPKNGT